MNISSKEIKQPQYTSDYDEIQISEIKETEPNVIGCSYDFSSDELGEKTHRSILAGKKDSKVGWGIARPTTTAKTVFVPENQGPD